MQNNKVYIIAEIGPNHNGSYKTAKRIINLLKKSGVDAIKFQLANPKNVYSKDSFKADYQIKNTKKGSIIEMSQNYQLSHAEHLKLYKLCKKNKIDYLCSAFDLSSLKFLIRNINLKYIKIPSGEITSIDMLNYLSKKRKKILLSTGMSTMKEIDNAIKLLNKNFKKKIVIMHCISSYPAKKNDLNLNLFHVLKKRYKCEIGYSDHSLGDGACLASVAMGATVIEKHVTLSKKLKGPDHKASANIKEFKEIIKKIRDVEKMMGQRKKKLLKSEINTQNVARKSIVSKYFLKKNTLLKENNLVFKRPGIGISPIYIKKIIGKKVRRNISADKVLYFKDIK